MDEREFLKEMSELIDLGRTKENLLKKAEVDDYLSEYNLSDDKLKMVYAYLLEHNVEVEGSDVKSESNSEQETKDSKYIAVYKKELRALKEYTKEELNELYEKLKLGKDTSIINDVINANLKRVVSIAGKYKNRGVLLEDLIGEGNIELISCVNSLFGNKDVVNCKKYIDHSINKKLIEVVDEALGEDGRISTILGRVNLLHEATNVLAKEFGRVATIEELSEFTHMDLEEIQMYVELSNDSIEIGKGD